MKNAFLSCFILSLFSLSYADSLRCGRGIVEIGDSKAYVTEMCGEPILEIPISLDKGGMSRERISDNIYSVSIREVISEMIYEINDNKKVLTFNGERLTTIEDY